MSIHNGILQLAGDTMHYDAMDVLKAAMTDVSFAPVEGVQQMRLGE